MINQNYKLNLIPFGVPVIVKASQYDKESRTINFTIYNGNVLFEIPSGSDVVVLGTKKDNTGFEYACSYDGSTVSFDIKDQMTVLPGEYQAEIRISNNGEILGTANFSFFIERSALTDDTIISETELPLIEEAIEKADEILANNYVKTVNNTSPDASGNVEVMGLVSSAANGDIATLNASGQVIDSGTTINELKCLVVEVSSFSSLPQTISNSNINSNHVLINSVLSNPSAQISDWTITTSDGSLTISGSISGSTTATLYLIEQRG